VKTIPAMLAATIAALAVVPLAVPLLALIDFVKGRRRMPLLRVYGFVLQYLINDCVEILLAGPLWLLSRFGESSDSQRSCRRHAQLQAWSIRTLARRAQQLLGIRVSIDAASDDQLGRGPAIVISRHVHLFDSSLPSLLYQRRGCLARGVIMAELLVDPGFDLVYQRTGSVFIVRDGAPDTAQRVTPVGEGLDERTVAVIFPEGRLFRPALLARGLERLATTNPLRAERLSGLSHLLPPRTAGLLALTKAAPTADLVVINHFGFDAVPSIWTLSTDAPLDLTITVTATRYARPQIPSRDAEFIEWLDAIWCEMDSELARDEKVRQS
jgi:1-acyl-sn-glycerol-3-phosphate acyltransferase